jgi:class 3 adenylate cyclase
MGARKERSLLILFADLTGYRVNARKLSDAALAERMHAYYVLVSQLVKRSKGRVVKSMGDAFLAVWDDRHAGRGAAALPSMKETIDAWWADRGWDSRVVMKAHRGRAVCGPFGAEGRFDVIGNEVNRAADLPARPIALSPAAFRALPPSDRARWKKQAATGCYVPRVTPG